MYLPHIYMYIIFQQCELNRPQSNMRYLFGKRWNTVQPLEKETFHNKILAVGIQQIQFLQIFQRRFFHKQYTYVYVFIFYIIFIFLFEHQTRTYLNNLLLHTSNHRYMYICIFVLVYTIFKNIYLIELAQHSYILFDSEIQRRETNGERTDYKDRYEDKEKLMERLGKKKTFKLQK